MSELLAALSDFFEPVCLVVQSEGLASLCDIEDDIFHFDAHIARRCYFDEAIVLRFIEKLFQRAYQTNIQSFQTPPSPILLP